MGPCLCGDTACPSCNRGGAEAEAHAEAVAERVVARLGRLQLHRALVIVDPDGAHDPDAPESGSLAPGQPLTEALELIPARDVPPELGRGATTDNARELLTEAVIELVIELESEAYLKGSRDTLDAQASSAPLILDLYAKWKPELVYARRAVNCDGTKRGPVPEVLVATFQSEASPNA